MITTTTMIATRNVPELGVRAGITRISDESDLFHRAEPGWRRVGNEIADVSVTRGQGPEAPSRAEPESYVPAFDPAMEVRVRDARIAEIEEEDRIEAARRRRDYGREFWTATRARLEQLDGPNLAPEERRAQRIFDDAAEAVAAVEAAHDQAVLAEITEMWGGPRFAPWR